MRLPRGDAMRMLALYKKRKRRKTCAGVLQEEYTQAMKYAMMCRLERDVDLATAEKLICSICKTKHYRNVNNGGKLLPIGRITT
jgi:hypothetical protein